MVEKPAVVVRPSPNRNGYAGTRHVEAICWHVTVGSAASSLGWLTNPASNASSNYLIARTGTIYELVPPEESAWANGKLDQPDLANPLIAGWVHAPVNPNTRTVSVEHERLTSANEQPGGFTEAQHQATVALGAWLCQQFGIPADRTHIIRHGQIDGVSRQHCPGLAESEMAAWVGEIAALVGAPATDPGFPGALNERGEAVLNGVNFGGTAVCVEEVVVRVRNDQGERYERTWAGHTLRPWVVR